MALVTSQKAWSVVSLVLSLRTWLEQPRFQQYKAIFSPLSLRSMLCAELGDSGSQILYCSILRGLVISLVCSQQQPDAGPSEDLPQCFLTVLNQHPVTQRGVPTLNLQRTAQIITAFGKRLALHNNHTARAGQCLRTAPRQRWEGSRHWGTQSRGPMHTCCQATPTT